MNTSKLVRIVLALILVIGGALLISACEEDPPAGLYDPAWTGGATPVVTSVTPPSMGLARVTVLTIAGTGFSPVASDNIVYFDATPGTILAATQTQLQVRAPNVISDSIKIKIAVRGATLFSDPPVRYRLDPATGVFGDLQSFEEPFGIACDTAGNVYASILSSGIGIGVKKFTPDGLRSNYSPQFSSSVNKWTGMKLGRRDTLFAVAGRNAIFAIPPGGGNAVVWKSAIGAASAGLSDLDFDSYGNIWAGGENTSFYRIKGTDRTFKAFPFRGSVRSVRVYQGYVYLGGKRDSLEKVWRFRIVTPDSVGPEEEYFNLSSLYGANRGGVSAITFNSAGDMYVGTDATDGIVLVHPGGVSEPMYPGVIAPQPIAFAWGKGATLYFSRGGTVATHAIIWLNTEKTSAPYYGQQLP